MVEREPTAAEYAVQQCKTDVAYAIRQLASVSCKVPANHYDPIRRALDAMERIQDNLNAVDEPDEPEAAPIEEVMSEWTVDEIMAREG